MGGLEEAVRLLSSVESLFIRATAAVTVYEIVGGFITKTLFQSDSHKCWQTPITHLLFPSDNSVTVPRLVLPNSLSQMSALWGILLELLNIVQEATPSPLLSTTLITAGVANDIMGNKVWPHLEDVFLSRRIRCLTEETLSNTSDIESADYLSLTLRTVDKFVIQVKILQLKYQLGLFHVDTTIVSLVSEDTEASNIDVDSERIRFVRICLERIVSCAHGRGKGLVGSDGDDIAIDIDRSVLMASLQHLVVELWAWPLMRLKKTHFDVLLGATGFHNYTPPNMIPVIHENVRNAQDRLEENFMQWWSSWSDGDNEEDDDIDEEMLNLIPQVIIECLMFQWWMIIKRNTVQLI